MVLTSKARQFLPLSACRPVNALAGIPLGLLHPSGNRLCGRLELARQLFGPASRSHQIDHLSPELRRISGSVAGHQTPQKSTSRVSIKPGQLQLHSENPKDKLPMTTQEKQNAAWVLVRLETYTRPEIKAA